MGLPFAGGFEGKEDRANNTTTESIEVRGFF
jgi:hypothetical protein